MSLHRTSRAPSPDAWARWCCWSLCLPLPTPFQARYERQGHTVSSAGTPAGAAAAAAPAVNAVNCMYPARYRSLVRPDNPANGLSQLPPVLLAACSKLQVTFGVVVSRHGALPDSNRKAVFELHFTTIATVSLASGAQGSCTQTPFRVTSTC